jgi:hypothetical protein
MNDAFAPAQPTPVESWRERLLVGFESSLLAREPEPAPPPSDAPPPSLLAQNDASRVAARQRGETTTRLLADAPPPDPEADTTAEVGVEAPPAAAPDTPCVAGAANAAASLVAAPPVADRTARADEPAPAAPAAASRARRSAYEPLATERIFVASHADKVMLTLQSLRSQERVPMDRLLEPSMDVVVGASHTDRVMMSLAAVLLEYDAPLPEATPEPGPLQIGAVGALLTEPITLDTAQLDIDLSSDRAPPVEAAAAEAGESVGAMPARDGWMALAEGDLDAMRGGFTTAEGLKVSFGIERAVYINGNLVTATSLNVASPGGASAAQPVGAANAGSLALIQSGPGNAFLSGTVPASSMGTVIQNTLNNQKIQNVTVINATVNSLEILKGINLQSSLRSAVIDSLRR